MFENLLDLVKQHAGDAIINNPAIPNERNEEAIHAASTSIFTTLKNAIAGGNISDVTNLFNGGNAGSSSLSQGIQGNFIQTLMSKFGLNQSQATSAAGGLIPNVLEKLVHKTNDSNDSSFDIQSILGSLTGNAGGGGMDLQGLIGKFTGGGSSSGGGLMDNIKGLFN